MASAGASFTPGLDQMAAGAKMAHVGLIGAKATETTTSAVKVATKAEEAAGVVKEGIYEFTDTVGKKYVGQSVNVPNRLKKHVKNGKLDPNQSVDATEVLGGKTARELAEHNRIQDITGGVPARFSDKVSNKVDPIGPNRSYLLDK
jgi:hypothetical protein